MCRAVLWIALLSCVGSPALGSPDGPPGTIWLDLGGRMGFGEYRLGETSEDTDSDSLRNFRASLGAVVAPSASLEVGVGYRSSVQRNLVSVFIDGLPFRTEDFESRQVLLDVRLRLYLSAGGDPNE